jgi:hypothetical protein
MLQIEWNVEKDMWLRSMRGLTFQMVEEAIALEAILDDTKHPNPQRAHQRILVFRVNGRCVAVPYVRSAAGLFLKTMYFSRELDKFYGDENV